MQSEKCTEVGAKKDWARNRMKGCGEWEDWTPRPLTVVPLLTLPLVGNLSLQNMPFYEHNLSKPTEKIEDRRYEEKVGGKITGMTTARSPPNPVFINADNV